MLEFGFSKDKQALHKDILTVAEEMHITDYVMLDFGSLQGRRTSGKPFPPIGGP